MMFIRTKSIKTPIYIVFLTTIVLLVSSCIKIDVPPSLEILVVDEFNNPIDQALVGLFESVDEWGMKENPVQAWKKTQDDGKVIFVELLEMNYYVVVEKGKLNNLRNEIRTTEVLKDNRITTLVIHID